MALILTFIMAAARRRRSMKALKLKIRDFRLRVQIVHALSTAAKPVIQTFSILVLVISICKRCRFSLSALESSETSVNDAVLNSDT
jgi:hypothetical protein